MIRCECKIIDKRCESFYCNENKWPEFLVCEPRIGNQVMSIDEKMVGMITRIIHGSNPFSDNPEFVILEIDQIKPNDIWE